jgi:hypothetical protein
MCDPSLTLENAEARATELHSAAASLARRLELFEADIRYELAAGEHNAKVLAVTVKARDEARNAATTLQALGVMVRKVRRDAACRRGEHVGTRSGYLQCLHCGEPLPPTALLTPSEAMNDDQEAAHG